jgi:hypothetical protein
MIHVGLYLYAKKDKVVMNFRFVNPNKSVSMVHCFIRSRFKK